jgi:hypothetical protein
MIAAPFVGLPSPPALPGRALRLLAVMQMNCQYYPELESCHKRTSCLPIQTAFDRPDESIGAEFLARQKRRSRKHLFLLSVNACRQPQVNRLFKN